MKNVPTTLLGWLIIIAGVANFALDIAQGGSPDIKEFLTLIGLGGAGAVGVLAREQRTHNNEKR